MDEEKKELETLDDVEKEIKREYIININGGNKNREIRLSSGTFKFGVFTFFVGIMIFIGACGYSVYSALNVQRNAAIIRDLQQAEELQQEQLLSISKKASELSEAVQNLTQQEQELRIQAGLNPPKEDKPIEENNQPEWNPPADENATPTDTVSAEENIAPTDTPPVDENIWNPPFEDEPAQNDYNGQGGPIGNLTIEEVKEALEILESRVNIRKESLDEFQAELKKQREMLAVAAGAVNTENYENSTWTPSTSDNTNTTYNLSQFGGNPAADAHMPSIWPTTGTVSSPYGLRWGGSDFHPGMDIANDMGTPIVATADGVVDYAGWNSGGYGNMVDIDHGNGIMTRYGHASQVVVNAGQHVKRGQVIAYMGSTGFSTGPHVHYEVIINGQRVNPNSYL